MNDGSSGMTIPNATIFADILILAKTAPFSFLLTYDTINLHFLIISSYHVGTSIEVTFMPLMIDEGWLTNNASLIKLTSTTATMFADIFIFSKTAPFTIFLTYDTMNLHFTRCLWTILCGKSILISFAKITCLFYIWFETYLVKVYLLGNYLPNLWVINLQIRMKMKETRASWRSFIRWIVSIYLRFFANKYFKKRDIIFLEDIIDLSKYLLFCMLHMETLSLMLRVSSKLSLWVI